MRSIFGFVVVIVVVLSSLLVYSAERTASGMMAHFDLFAEDASMKTLGVDSKQAWDSVLSLFPSLPGRDSVDPRRAVHLVEIYLRSRGLAACGHARPHETAGTPCSFSQGTALALLYEGLLGSLRERGAIDDRSYLYLRESEPATWEETTTHFFFEGRILPASIEVSDSDVVARREELVKQGFQTAIHWPTEEIRRSLVQSQQGETLEQIDSLLGISRGVLKRSIVNTIVRPLYLLSHFADQTYEGGLEDLPRFVSENLDKPTRSPESAISFVPARSPEPAAPRAVPEPEPAALSAVSESKNAEVIVLPRPSQPARTQGDGFARAYGGTRFRVGWGR